MELSCSSTRKQIMILDVEQEDGDYNGTIVATIRKQIMILDVDQGNGDDNGTIV